MQIDGDVQVNIQKKPDGEVDIEINIEAEYDAQAPAAVPEPFSAHYGGLRVTGRTQMEANDRLSALKRKFGA